MHGLSSLNQFGLLFFEPSELATNNDQKILIETQNGNQLIEAKRQQPRLKVSSQSISQVSQLLTDIYKAKSSIINRVPSDKSRAEAIERLLKSREQLEDEDFIAQQVKSLGFLSDLAKTLRGRAELTIVESGSMSSSEVTENERHVSISIVDEDQIKSPLKPQAAVSSFAVCYKVSNQKQETSGELLQSTQAK